MNYAGKWCDAQQRGHVTIERLENGKALLNARLFDTLDAISALEIWSEASKKYAREASGPITCFIHRQDDYGIFQNIELPELLKNEKVDFINGIPREQLKSIYDRDTSQDKKEALSRIHSEIASEEPKHLQERTRGDDQEKSQEPAIHQENKDQKTETLRSRQTNGQGELCFVEITGLRPGESIIGLRFSTEHSQMINDLKGNQTLTLSIDAVYQSIGREYAQRQIQQEREQQVKEQAKIQQQQEQHHNLNYSL